MAPTTTVETVSVVRPIKVREEFCGFSWTCPIHLWIICHICCQTHFPNKKLKSSTDTLSSHFVLTFSSLPFFLGPSHNAFSHSLHLTHFTYSSNTHKSHSSASLCSHFLSHTGTFYPYLLTFQHTRTHTRTHISHAYTPLRESIAQW